MQILHVIPSFDLATGGPPRIALRLAAGAAQLGHGVSIISYDSPHAHAEIAQDRAEVPSSELVNQIVLPEPDRFERLFARRARREIDRIVSKFDLVHVHSLWHGICRTALASARKHGVPYVILANGMLDPWSLEQKKFKKRLALMLGMWKTLDRAAFMHAGNQDEKAGIELLRLTCPIEIIPNGIYPQEFDPLPDRGQFYAAHPELQGDPFIFFLSRLHYKKGLDYLAGGFARVARKYPRLRLVVVGPDEGAREGFLADIRAAGLEERVHLLGSIYGRERYFALRDAVCFCLPSRQEGFSIAILEAMACGTPVVVSTNCHFPEVAQVGAGEVVPLDVEALGEALDRVLSSESLREQMGAAGSALVHREFTWPKVARQTIAAYERALRRNTGTFPGPDV